MRAALLLAARDRRERPLTDDKILTDWNGLMIGAMARVGELLDESRYVEAASRAAEFVLSRLRDDSGTLLHTFRDGRARVPAFLDDYAFLIEGLLRLRAATGADRWGEEAVRLAEEQERRLGDTEAGGFFAAGEDPAVALSGQARVRRRAGVGQRGLGLEPDRAVRAHGRAGVGPGAARPPFLPSARASLRRPWRTSASCAPWGGCRTSDHPLPPLRPRPPCPPGRP